VVWAGGVAVSFTWPLALLGLFAVPLLVGALVLQQRRKRRNAIVVSSVSLIRAAMPKRSRWRRYLPLGLFLAALSFLTVASARPRTSVTVPISDTTIVLALDVSRSMCATDVEPNRLAAAQKAAISFVEGRAGGTRVGIVAFADSAQVLVPPTTDKVAVVAAIEGLTTTRGTAIGAATLKSLDAIAEVNPDVAKTGPVDGAPVADGAPDPAGAPKKVGDYVPDIIVLLTDGANTRGIAPLEAAQQAVDRRVRVYTIGFGTTNPTGAACTRDQLGGDALGGGGGFPPGGGGGGGGRGGRSPLVADEPTLMEVAKVTGGEYFKAENADQLKGVFEKLPSRVVLQKKEREISVIFALLGGVLAAAAVTLSLRWNRFP
jgi:Ca-activated chloride channel homolog